MSIDMSEFYQVFFDEAAELLGDMENLLIDLDIDNPGDEELNAIFRVAHSIKGGAATFGFADMTEVTHVLESLLDRLRKHELALRAEMVDAFLMARDVVKAQLAGHRGDGAADPAKAAQVREWLSNLAAGGAGQALANAASPAGDSSRIDSSAAAQPAAIAGRHYRVEFNFRSTTAAFDNLLRNLRTMGSAEMDAASRSVQLPLIAQDNANVAYEPCVVNVITDALENDLWEALAFVVDPAGINIEEVLPTAATPAKNTAQARVGTTAPTGTTALTGTTAAAGEAGPTTPSTASLPAGDEPGFGFFEPLYQAIAGTGAPDSHPPAAAAITAAVTAPVTSVQTIPAAAVVELRAAEGAAGRRASDNNAPVEEQRGRRATDKPGPAASSDASSIRVNIEKVDQLINLVGELVITQSMLAQTALTANAAQHERLVKGLGQLERNTRDLQESVMSIRMMPISFVFSRFPRLVRDLASKLGKEVELKTVGESTELDKGLIEKIADPLTHLVRNSIDHGIENPEKRVAAGKAAKGTITLRAFHQGGNIVIEVLDDGAGLDRSKIIAKARAQGLAVTDTMPDQEVWLLIFAAGFSTAEVVTDVSGRGVGMDVVRRNIQALGGSVEIDSALGAGTRISIRLPLTLAIVDGLSVAVGDQTFIVPLTYIIESLQPRMEEIKTVGNCNMVIHVRGEYLPIVRAHDFYGVKAASTDMSAGIIVILESDGTKKALFVDALLGQNQVVIKSLESNYRRVRGVSGATIMGDGTVGLIMDVNAVVRSNVNDNAAQGVELKLAA